MIIILLRIFTIHYFLPLHSLATTQNHAIFGDGQTSNINSGNSNSKKQFELARVRVIGVDCKFNLQCKKLIVPIFQHFSV